LLSLSGSPVANPWYAESKNGTNFFSLNIWANFSHCSDVGSTPVGLWAHACNNTIVLDSNLFKLSHYPSKSNPHVEGL